MSSYRILRLCLFATNVEALKEFYSDVLELPIQLEDGMLTVLAGSTRINFAAAESGPLVYHFAFEIPENQVEEAREWLAGRVSLTPLNAKWETVAWFKDWNAHSVYFKDPEGNVLEFIGRHSQATRSDRPFSASSVLRISEFGCVVKNVAASAQKLQDGLGWSPFQAPTADIAAMGGPEALLILVRKGRPWYGSGGVRAEVNPAIVELSGPLIARVELDRTLIRPATE